MSHHRYARRYARRAARRAIRHSVGCLWIVALAASALAALAVLL
jgi:hypothetical protein